MQPALLLAIALPLFAHDWLIVPGERVGPITAASTEASLRAAFGSDAVVPATIQIDKDTSAPGVEIFRGRPGESLAVVWPRMDGTLRWPLHVIPCYGSPGKSCRWRTADGIGIGASLEQLEKLNGKPFWLYPSDAETFSDLYWDGGKLADTLGEDIELVLHDPAPESTRPKFEDDSGYPRSNDKAFAGRGFHVAGLRVYLLSRERTVPANDWTIVPGKRFGPIPMNARVEPLRETLGPENVHRDVMDMGEGFIEPAISVFGSDPIRKVLLNPIAKQVCGGLGSDAYPGCKWRIAGGLPLLTTVEAMEKLNGRPFVFAGCCWDGGGALESWEGGLMSKHPHLFYRVWCDGDEPERLSGDGVRVRSGDPDIRKLKCHVGVASFMAQ